VVVGTTEIPCFGYEESWLVKHGISIRVRSWFYVVSGFDVERSYGNYRNTMFGV